MFPIELFRDTVLRITGILDRLSIRFHLTGGAALISYTEPRATQDVDVVVDQTMLQSQFNLFIAEVREAGFLFEEQALRSAVARKKSFQLLDLQKLIKLDFYPRELIPGELDRAVSVTVFDGVTLPVVSKSDLVLSKLIWISQGSGKSRADVRWLWRILDDDAKDSVRAYAQKRELAALLDEVLSESDQIDI